MSWKQVGALDGGTVGGLTVVEDGGKATLLAVTPAGGFRSEDGRSWAPLSPEPGPALADALAASPAYAKDRTLFVAGRTGVFRSTDGGASWRHALAGEVLCLAVSPAFDRDGTLLIGTGQDGVLTSEDGGVSWHGANSGLLDLSVLAVALSPGFGEDRTAFAGTASALYRSRNGGRSWREVRLNLGEPAVQVLAVSPRFAEDRLVLAGTEAHGLLRSDDGGARFSEVPELADRGISAVSFAPNGTTVADVHVVVKDGKASIDVGAGQGVARVLLVGFDREHVTPIGHGENRGRTMAEANIVRSFRSVAEWSGAPIHLDEQLPDGEQVAVILEAPDGRIVGASKAVRAGSS